MSEHGAWTMEDERRYLETIGIPGDHPRSEILPPLDRLEALEGYLAGIEKRVNWDRLDPKACREYAQALITAERAGRKPAA